VQLKEELKNLPDPINKIGTQFSTTAFGVKNFVEELENVEKSVDKLTVDSMKKFEDSIVKSLKTGKLEFKDFADYVVEQMLRIAIQQMILRPLTGYFESFFGSFGSIFREDGGSVKAGSPYIVGEGGAEMFVPNSSGQIITNENLANMTSPSTQPVSVSFNISTVDASGFDQLLASRKGMITAMINNAMNARGKMGVI
jgi:phage-related minor tail protein